MKRAICFLLALLLVIPMLAAGFGARGADPLTATAVVLMDAGTGEILYEKNPNKKMYPASITKVMTGLLVVENCTSHQIATASAGAVKIPKGYVHIALQAGDEITVKDAMYAMMLPSANDAANVLAEHVGGSRKGFATMMNQRARELGATGTNFVNPSGMADNNHYTTAYDMALITRAASENSEFMNYFGAASYTLPSFNSQTEETEVINYQYMLQEDKEQYNPYVIGGKIGYTGQAKHTMTTVAKKDGRTLVCVVLGCTREGKFTDTQTLLDYGFGL